MVMNKFKKIVWCAGILAHATPLIISASATTASNAITSSDDDYNATSYTDDTSDYETRISDLEDAVTTLQTQLATLQKQLQAAKVIPAASTTTGGATNLYTNSAYSPTSTTLSTNATNSLYGNSTTKTGTTTFTYPSSSDATKYSSSTAPYSPVNYGTGSLYNRNGTKKSGPAFATTPKTPTTPKEQIANLQDKNKKLEMQIARHQAALHDLNQSANMNPASLAHKKQAELAAATKAQNIIAANNEQIAQLQASEQATTTPILGSMNSSKPVNKNKKIRNRVL